MRRVAHIIAHVLATTAVVACGGKTIDIPDEGTGTTPTATSTSTTAPPPTTTSVPPTVPTTPPPPPVCTTPAKVISEGRGCEDVIYHACGIPQGVDPTDGLTQAECEIVCKVPNTKPNGYWGCAVHMTDELPGPSFDCYTCVEGRRPAGYVEPRMDATVAGWLAHAADLEHVSIDAFVILQRELFHHGAPSALLAAARDAEKDEIRHARMMGNLAMREGATLERTVVAHGEPRGLLAIALENAVEGCIRETYGAVVAGYQAEHASRIDVRKLMGAVYVDETAHAELAWNVHGWIMGRLGRDERREVERAMEAAIDELASSAEAPVPAAQRTELGLPAPDVACALVRTLRAQLFDTRVAA